ncbi:MAG: hypothetical protein LJE62_00515 [Silicimonas sp.]|jgi:hypothetical protein|nr:hypothetical protein [Silicimonas sp.]
MQNVIAFPRKAAPAPAKAAADGAKTLFLHIRRTTLIVHLAAPQPKAFDRSRTGKRI